MRTNFVNWGTEALDSGLYFKEEFASDRDWSCLSSDGKDDVDHAVKIKSRFPAYNPNAEKLACH